MKRFFRWMHIAWGLIGLGSCLLLATATDGHPPGLVFVPVAAVIWLAGHLTLWGSHKLATRGADKRRSGSDESANWPPFLVLLTLVLGAVFIIGTFAILWQLFFERERLNHLTVPLAYWVPASVCFFGALLRQNWTRLLLGGGFLFLGSAIVYEMIASHMRGYQNSALEWVTVIGVSASLVLCGVYMLRSQRIRRFYSGA